MSTNILRLLPAGSFVPAAFDAAAQVEALEGRLVRPLPADVAELYRLCGSVDLFGVYRFLPLAEIRTVGEAQAGDPTDDSAPRTWIALVDMWDGNYAGVDLVPNADGTHDWLDFDHEMMGESNVVATSLAEFLTRALAFPETPFWLEPEFHAGRVHRYENPPSYWRRVDAKWWASLGEENGAERCTSEGCARMRIALSVKCRKHHYEMMTKRACPFDD